MWKHVLFLLATLFFSSATETDKVLIIDEINYMDMIRAYGELFMLVYAPNCGLCRKGLEDLSVLAEQLETLKGVRIAKLNGLANPHLRVAFNVTAYPTYLYMINQTAHEYTGPPTLKEMAKWIKHKRTATPNYIRTYPDLSQYIQNNPLVFVLFTKERSEIAFEYTELVKFMDQKLFKVSIHTTAANEYNITGDTLVVFKQYDNKRKDLTDLTKMNEFIEEEMVKWALPLEDEAYTYFFEKEHPGLFLFSESPPLNLIEEILPQLKMRVCYADLKKNLRFAELLGIDYRAQPVSLIIETKKNLLTKYISQGQFLKESLLQFQSDYLSKTATIHVKSEPLPPPNSNIIVRSNFKEKVFENTEDVLVLYYTLWCSLSSELEKILTSLKPKFPSLQIYKIDAMANDLEGIEIFKFPTLRLYPHDKKEIEFTEDIEEEEVEAFLKKHLKPTKNKEKKDLEEMESTYNSAYRSPGNLPEMASSEDEYTPRGQSVSSFAYREETNHRYRPYMEDAHKIVDSFMGDPNQGFFAIFDGHGGREAVDYCKLRMHEELRKALNETPEDVAGAMTRCFERIDNELRLTGAVTSGTTATVGLVRKENHMKVLYVGNVGDSKAVIVSRTGATVLTHSHLGTDPSEIDRIMNEGGILIRGRVGGSLAVTRALGDFHLKSSGVSCVPFVSKTSVPHDSILVMGSDGIWDIIGEGEISSMRGSSFEIAEQVLKRALEGGSQDNLSVMVVCLS